MSRRCRSRESASAEPLAPSPKLLICWATQSANSVGSDGALEKSTSGAAAGAGIFPRPTPCLVGWLSSLMPPACSKFSREVIEAMAAWAACAASAAMS